MQPRTKLSKIIAEALIDSGRSAKELCQFMKVTPTYLALMRNHQIRCKDVHVARIIQFFAKEGISLIGLERAVDEPLVQVIVKGDIDPQVKLLINKLTKKRPVFYSLGLKSKIEALMLELKIAEHGTTKTSFHKTTS